MAYKADLGYDPDLDYSAELIRDDLTGKERTRLWNERQTKVASVYPNNTEPFFLDTGRTFTDIYNSGDLTPAVEAWNRAYGGQSAPTPAAPAANNALPDQNDQAYQTLLRSIAQRTDDDLSYLSRRYEKMLSGAYAGDAYVQKNADAVRAELARRASAQQPAPQAQPEQTPAQVEPVQEQSVQGAPAQQTGSGRTYTIGADLGHALLAGLGMEAGASVTASDGSVWTRNADGSVTVRGTDAAGQPYEADLVDDYGKLTLTGAGGEEYVISSPKGLAWVQTAQNGDTMTAGDGSVWQKVNGLLAVTKNGVTYVGAPAQQAGGAPAQQTGGTPQTGSAIDYIDLLRTMEAEKLSNALAGLSNAYQQSMAGYDRSAELLPQTYEAVRNQLAAQNAIAQQAFDERATAAGLSSGARAQADLSHSAALQSGIAQANRQQANALGEIDLARDNLTQTYQTALAQAGAEARANLASAIYQELVRQQGLAREDEQTNYERWLTALQMANTFSQNAKSDQMAMAQLGAQYGDLSGLNALGIDTTAYEQAQGAYTPDADYNTAWTVYNNWQMGKGAQPVGTLLRDIGYWLFADPDYFAGSAAGGGVNTGNSGTGGNGNGNPGVTYNNGGLTTAQVEDVQRAWNAAHPDATIAVDGYWGPNSQKVTGYGDASAARDKLGVTAGAQGGESAAAANPASAVNDLAKSIENAVLGLQISAQSAVPAQTPQGDVSERAFFADGQTAQGSVNLGILTDHSFEGIASDLQTLQNAGRSPSEIGQRINAALNAGWITGAEADQLRARFVG